LLNVKERVLCANTSKFRYLMGKIMNAENPIQARDYLAKLNDL